MPRKNYYERFASLELKSRQDFAAFFKLNKVKLSESSIRNHFPELAAELARFATRYPAQGYPELVYAYVHNLQQPPLCQHCSTGRVSFKQYSHGYFAYCSVVCSSNSAAKQAAIRQTNLTRYGVENPSAASTIKEKRRSTFLTRYGSVGVLGNAQVAQKARQTCQLRYGNAYYFASTVGEQAVIAGMQKCYGVGNPMQHPDLLQRSLQTRTEQGVIYRWTTEQEQSLKLYRLAVKLYTERAYRKNFHIINPDKKRRSKHQYHLDHIFPILEGWLNGVPPEEIAHPNNLQLLWCTDNIAKGARTSFDVSSFYERIGKAGREVCGVSQ